MISGKTKSKVFERIMKLIRSENMSDRQIGRALILSNFETFTHLQFKALLIFSQDITICEIQQFQHDRWKEEKKSERRDLQEN